MITGKCHDYEYPCSDGGCIRSRYLCDERADCDDGSDEWVLRCGGK